MTSIEKRLCGMCHEELLVNCFRKGDKACVWCTWSSVTKRAAYRCRDKLKLAKDKLRITQAEFVAWYVEQPDCAVCPPHRLERRRPYKTTPAANRCTRPATA